jgi:hypothetical protein
MSAQPTPPQPNGDSFTWGGESHWGEVIAEAFTLRNAQPIPAANRSHGPIAKGEGFEKGNPRQRGFRASTDLDFRKSHALWAAEKASSSQRRAR